MAVYAIQCGDNGPIKIGVAEDIDKRLAHLQTSHHQCLNVVRVWPGSNPEERWLHDRFSDRRLLGEWFDIPTEMLPEQLGRLFKKKRQSEGAGRARSPLYQLIKKLGSEAVVASRLGVSRSTVRGWQSSGVLPAFHAIGINSEFGIPIDDMMPFLVPPVQRGKS